MPKEKKKRKKEPGLTLPAFTCNQHAYGGHVGPSHNLIQRVEKSSLLTHHNWLYFKYPSLLIGPHASLKKSSLRALIVQSKFIGRWLV